MAAMQNAWVPSTNKRKYMMKPMKAKKWGRRRKWSQHDSTDFICPSTKKNCLSCICLFVCLSDCVSACMRAAHALLRTHVSSERPPFATLRAWACVLWRAPLGHLKKALSRAWAKALSRAWTWALSNALMGSSGPGPNGPGIYIYICIYICIYMINYIYILIIIYY